MRRLRRGTGVFLGVAVLVAMPLAVIGRAVYCQTLNRRLLVAVKANDTDQTIDLLTRGADANVHDDPPRKLSLWHVLLEALHLQRKPVSNSPSVLRLALEWRPPPTSLRQPTLEETPLIRALRAEGARMDGPEIMAYVARTYAFCTSYQDTGRSTGRHVGMPFRTAFRRPDRFYFEYSPEPGVRRILWQNRKGMYSWGIPKPRVTREPSLLTAIAGVTGDSETTAIMTPSLLSPEVMAGWARLNTSYPQARLTGTKMVEGVVCYEVVPGDESFAALYIDRTTFLVRQTVDGNAATNDQQVILFHPQVNMPIPESTFQFPSP